MMEFTLTLNLDGNRISTAADLAFELRKLADVLSGLHDDNNSAAPSEWHQDQQGAPVVAPDGFRLGQWAIYHVPQPPKSERGWSAEDERLYRDQVDSDDRERCSDCGEYNVHCTCDDEEAR